MNNGFDLDSIQSGLKNLAKKYTTDSFLKKKTEQLGNAYMSNGDTLLHGDYYPGSWMQTSDGIKIIDPEFSFMGPPEFDSGVLAAHLIMSGHRQNTIVDLFAINYKPNKNFNIDLAQRFTAVEIFRRIIGIAQLPLEMSITEKSDLLEKAYRWLKK